MYRLAAEKSTLITQSLTDEAPENTTVDNEQHSSTSSQDQQLSPIDSLLGTVEAEFSASDDEESPASSASSSKLAAFSLLGIGILIGAGFILKPHLKGFLDFFITAAEEWGPLGYLAYAGAYVLLEVLAVPAIPLTMTAGAIFGPAIGSVIVLTSGTLAATIAFLIARYAARDRILQIAQKNKKFAAIDRAIGKDSFKFVTLLRLSPLLPLAASNYLYGLTSVKLGPYVLGSFVGMAPGTYAIVTTGHVGKAVFLEGEGTLSPELWQVGLGLAGTALALGFIGRLASQAIKEADNDSES